METEKEELPTYEEITAIYGEIFVNNDVKVQIVVSKVASTLSIIGSTFILQSIWRDSKRRSQVKDRVMFCLCIADILYSFQWFFGHWMVPRGQGPGAVGTIGTCTLNGILGFWFGPASQMYSSHLALCYLLVYGLGYMEDRMRKLQPYLLISPIVVPFFLITLAPLMMGNFNAYGGPTCGSTPFPVWCDGLDTPCLRGNQAAYNWNYGGRKWRVFFQPWLFYYGLVIMVPSMVFLFRSIRRRELSNESFNPDGEISDRRHSKAMAMQGLLYVLAFILTYLVFFMQLAQLTFTDNYHFFTDQQWLAAMSGSLPLQGLFNALVYVRPRYLAYLRKYPERSLKNCFLRLLGFTTDIHTGEDGDDQDKVDDEEKQGTSSDDDEILTKSLDEAVGEIS